MADRYVTVDFTGRRQFTLVETESSRWSDYVWNDGKGLYNVYREKTDFGQVESVSIWYNNLPKGQETRCVIGPVKALPMVPCTVNNPTISINGQAIILPVEMSSGSYLECDPAGNCVLYGPKGEVTAQVRAPNGIPLLSAGENQIQFSCDATDGPAPRVKLTVIAHGQPL